MLYWDELVEQRYPMTAECAVASDLERPVVPLFRQERICHLLQVNAREHAVDREPRPGVRVDDCTLIQVRPPMSRAAP
jgi:hypothetical protein